LYQEFPEKRNRGAYGLPIRREKKEKKKRKIKREKNRGIKSNPGQQGT